MDLRFPGRQWITAVHPSAVVDETATLGPGTVVMAGAIIQANARIGRHVIVSTGSSVDHDCAVTVPRGDDECVAMLERRGFADAS